MNSPSEGAPPGVVAGQVAGAAAGGSRETVGSRRPGSAVVVDIGGDRGALVIRAGSDDDGREVEIHPTADPAARQHVWVLPRLVASGVVSAAIFPSLRAGEWVVLGRDGERWRTVLVRPGAVCEVLWGFPAVATPPINTEQR
jgi:hypothetical protein